MNRFLVCIVLFTILANVSGQDVGMCVFYWGSGYQALHRSLPIGTRIWVSANGKSVDVTISGRGAYGNGIILELSSAAFSRLADMSFGIINCSFLTYGVLG